MGRKAISFAAAAREYLWRECGRDKVQIDRRVYRSLRAIIAYLRNVSQKKKKKKQGKSQSIFRGSATLSERTEAISRQSVSKIPCQQFSIYDRDIYLTDI